MNDSASIPTASRGTLKLKVGARKSPDPVKTSPAPRPQSKAAQKPGATWSDEYKERMQADMDALATR
jgi:hypothetical protein